MIKDHLVAKQISDLMLDYSRQLDRSIAMVQRECDDEDFKTYRLATAKVLAEIYLEVLMPLYREHPDLKPEGMN